MFTPEKIKVYEDMMREGVRQEIAWGQYVIGNDVQGLNAQMVSDYIRYLGISRWSGLGFGFLYATTKKNQRT